MLSPKHKFVQAILILMVAICMPGLVFAQTGKISGQVTDAETGEPLPGVNVILVGTEQGAATDAEGYYDIINVTPGTYSLRASFIGYAQTTIEDIRVNIDQTTTIDFELRAEAIAGEEVVVEASTPVVQADVSANVANISSAEMENIPVMSLDEVVGLEAGIEPGLSVRGSDADEVSYVVDGNTMRLGRSNAPYTNISYTSVKEVKVQTGGFNAEYGNVRSGLVNVVTKEGSADQYSADLVVRYTPPRNKYFGSGPNEFNGYFIRPYKDPDVMMEGTANGAWSEYTQRQYPFFEGWETVRDNWAGDNNPDNNLSVAQLQELFDWYHRKDTDISDPDYEIDASFGGPVPVVSDALGNLRFWASYRENQKPYIVPQNRRFYKDWTGRLKLSSNLSSSMKLVVQSFYSHQYGLADNKQGWPSFFEGELPPYPWSGSNHYMANVIGNGHGTHNIWANDNWNPTDHYHNMVSADFTHTLSPKTFYDVRVQRMYSDYNTVRPELRDTSTVVNTIGTLELDESPFGWWMANLFSPGGVYMGGHWGEGRDTSNVTTYNIKADLTSQLNRFLQIKTGLEYIYSDYHIRHGEYQLFFAADLNPRWRWDRQPIQGAAYAQSKLEFRGMIAQLGLRLDYFTGGGNWYDYDPYSRAFSPEVGKDELDGYLEQSPTENLVNLSPRLGIAFPVTAESKLFFNYGHFRQSLDPQNLFMVREIVTGAVDRMGNPNHPLPRTISYELGYEHSLMNQFLVRASGYYKALEDQVRQVRYVSLDERVDYNRMEPLNYEDIRGFEISVRKNRGQHFRGFFNYTYMARKAGNFGFGTQYENPVEQQQFERNSRAHYQNKPVPEPYARFNLEFIGPYDFGPQFAGIRPLGGWHLNLLGEWRAGQAFTWDGETDIPGLEFNVRWKDYYMLDLRLSKDFNVSDIGRLRVFADITNILNLKHMSRTAAWFGSRDFQNYMYSLHLPGDTFEEAEQQPYNYIAGDDRPGEYRRQGVEFQPIEVVNNVDGMNNPSDHPLYYETETERYMQWVEGSWQEAEQSFVNQVLDDKAYIDMPNLSFMRYLNPRSVRLGIRITF